MGANANMQLYFAGESARSLRKMERRLERERRLTDEHMVGRWLAERYGPVDPPCTCEPGRFYSSPAIGAVEAHAVGCPRWGRPVRWVESRGPRLRTRIWAWISEKFTR